MKQEPNPSGCGQAPIPGGGEPRALPGIFRDAMLYWEVRRIGYNAILVLVTLAWVLFTWPHFRPALTWRSGLLLLILAAAANLCYSAAYPVDLLFQRSSCRSAWRHRRWIMWWGGTALAVALACYWIADEIYPAVG
jgi:hypothetical protein